MRVEVSVTTDSLTDEEKSNCKRTGSKLRAVNARCTRCGNSCRGTGKSTSLAEREAIQKVSDTCQKSTRIFGVDGDPGSGLVAIELNKYVKRKVPNGCLIRAQWTDGKWYRCTVSGWSIISGYGEISKAVPVRIVSEDECNPDRKMMERFAIQLARRGYKVTLFGSIVDPPILKPRKRSPNKSGGKP